MAKACSGILGIKKIQLINSTTERRNINIRENVAVPTLTHVIIPTIGINSKNGIIQKTKKFFGSMSANLQFGSPIKSGRHL